MDAKAWSGAAVQRTVRLRSRSAVDGGPADHGGDKLAAQRTESWWEVIHRERLTLQ